MRAVARMRHVSIDLALPPTSGMRVQCLRCHCRGKPMDVTGPVLEKLRNMRGVVACWVLPQQEINSLMRLETESNLRLGLPGIPVMNEGIREVLKRKYVIAVCHSPQLRHPPGPIVTVRSDDEVAAQEIFEADRMRGFSGDPNTILVGKSLVFYRDALKRTEGKRIRLCYPALPFPELDEVVGVRDVVSVTIGYSAHSELARRAGWDSNDPNLGSVLIGFNGSSN
jgi:hypothetical protein